MKVSEKLVTGIYKDIYGFYHNFELIFTNRKRIQKRAIKTEL